MNGALTPTPVPSPKDRSAIAVTVDNILRRRLRISDPRSSAEVADALRRVYVADNLALEREASGLPFAGTLARPPRTVDTAPSGSELDQATDDVARDLDALVKNSQLKDIEPELQGWWQAIRGLIAEGTAAARVALDPRSRDRAFAARRQLGDYARLARFVGALTCGHQQAYRRLAQSLDEVSALILVLAGESLARIGFGGGRFLLQAPASELQARRDAVTLALRNLNGTTQEAYGSKDWPYGLRGLREVLRLLDDSGHADLRVLFEENSIAKLMDDLLDRASSVDTRGLRALGATAAVSVQRLNRLVQIVDDRVQPGSPPLVAFLEAIRLFTDGFQGNGSGYRLLFIARPPAVFYGLYGIGGPDLPTRRLIEMVVARGRLAELLDCYSGCNCCEDPAICQILLDKLLYDTDRAIDLYALGSDPLGDLEPEWRAAAFGMLVRSFLEGEGACMDGFCLPALADLAPTLELVRNQLLGVDALGGGLRIPIGSVRIPPVPPLSADQRLLRLTTMRDELCLQRQMDARWGSLLASLAPSCVGAGTALLRTDAMIARAIGLLGLPEGTECAQQEPAFPPTVEEALQVFDDLRLERNQRAILG